ncbi:hypothetical protein OGATHE_001680 [Ogataea polymorpha]|uniref:Uncharacterized protein n=1 Tax=Ogataea polymorpha TaxID=460523 RepID=A0A9P8PPJ7_9ASCO|nr:hypothetical protein OGATHE_001680 [Ogataea polymorpha]
MYDPNTERAPNVSAEPNARPARNGLACTFLVFFTGSCSWISYTVTAASEIDLFLHERSSMSDSILISGSFSGSDAISTCSAITSLRMASSSGAESESCSLLLNRLQLSSHTSSTMWSESNSSLGVSSLSESDKPWTQKPVSCSAHPRSISLPESETSS